MSESLLPGPVWLLGCGNMAGAMLKGWLARGADPRQIKVIRPSGRPAAEGIRVLTSLPEAEVPALVLLGFKPRSLDEVAPLLAPVLAEETILVSILAGVELASLRARFAPRALFRAMPNLPVRLGKGVTNLIGESGGRNLDAGAKVDRLMAALGHCEWYEDESLFQAAGLLTGAGPAFVYRFIDALAAAGAAIGLPQEQAARLATLMVEGAGALAAGAGRSPADLARQVASPGGTTEAELAVLDREGALQHLVTATLQAGLARSGEMAEAARRQD